VPVICGKVPYPVDNKVFFKANALTTLERLTPIYGGWFSIIPRYGKMK
jgi:hypothetical protein